MYIFVTHVPRHIYQLSDPSTSTINLSNSKKVASRRFNLTPRQRIYLFRCKHAISCKHMRYERTSFINLLSGWETLSSSNRPPIEQGIFFGNVNTPKTPNRSLHSPPVSSTNPQEMDIHDVNLAEGRHFLRSPFSASHVQMLG